MPGPRFSFLILDLRCSGERRHEAVSAPGQRLDVPRPLRLIFQHSAEVKDLVLDDLGLDYSAGPDRVEQLLLADHLADRVALAQRGLLR